MTKLKKLYKVWYYFDYSTAMYVITGVESLLNGEMLEKSEAFVSKADMFSWVDKFLLKTKGEAIDPNAIVWYEVQ